MIEFNPIDGYSRKAEVPWMTENLFIIYQQCEGLA
jgi:hypothetical protein